MVETAVWTTAREEALRKGMEEGRTDEIDLSMKAIYENRQRYKDMLSNVAVRDAIGEPGVLGSLTEG